MGFLDNLENSLKNLETQEEAAEGAERAQARRETERARARAAAPWADRLRNGAYTAELLRQVTRIGFSQRTKVNMAWLDSTLRLDARDKRLELRPTPQGVVAVFMENAREIRTMPVDLEGRAEDLARTWLTPA